MTELTDIYLESLEFLYDEDDICGMKMWIKESRNGYVKVPMPFHT
jgi:hypothetical protein